MPNNFNFAFVLSVMGAVVSCVVVANLYVWPSLRSLPRKDALRVLASVHAFRFLGLNFVVTGFVSAQLNSVVANQIAWGDFTAAVLALFSIAALSWHWPFAISIVWASNLWGAADLLNAYYKGSTQVADVGLFGAGIYVPALFVPILLTAHAMAFILLSKRRHVVSPNRDPMASEDLSNQLVDKYSGGKRAK